MNLRNGCRLTRGGQNRIDAVDHRGNALAHHLVSNVDHYRNRTEDQRIFGHRLSSELLTRFPVYYGYKLHLTHPLFTQRDSVEDREPGRRASRTVAPLHHRPQPAARPRSVPARDGRGDDVPGARRGS
jgi:hypothetical protein